MRLTTTVMLRHPDDGRLVVLRAGEDVPAWAAPRIKSHALKGDDAAAVQRDAATATVAPLEADAHPEPADDEPADPAHPGKPSRPGDTATRDAWAAYARSLGVRVTSRMTRQQIIDAVDEVQAP